MNKKYHLALNDKNDQTKESIIKLIVVDVLFFIIYQMFPLLSRVFGKYTVFEDIALIIYFLTFTLFINYFCLTTKVFNKRLKLHTKVIPIVLFIFVAITVLESLSGNISVFKLEVPKIIAITLRALIAATCEEFIFRVFLFNIVILILYRYKYNIFWAAIVSSIIFGLIHIINGSHQPLVSTIGQMLGALFLGVILVCLHIYSNGIFWCIVLHFLQDFAPEILSKDTGNSRVKLLIIGSTIIVITMLTCVYMLNRRYLELSENVNSSKK